MATKAKSKKPTAKKSVKAGKKTAKKAPAKKKAVAKKPVKKTMAKKAHKPVAKKAVAKKPVKKPAAKKAPAKKPVPKKAALKPQAKKLAPKAPVKAQAKPAPKAMLVKSAPVAKPVAKAAPQPLVPQVAAQKSAALAQSLAAKKLETKKLDTKKTAQDRPYRVGDFVVYPTHGVGRIMAEETQHIGEIELRMLVISFEKDKMTLRVPTHRAAAAGLRHVSSTDQMVKVFETLKGKARTSRGMWSRRAQEYEAKINSGNIFSVAEVVRDLHQNVDQSERSYSERMIYESALGRLVGELAAAEAIDQQIATEKLLKLLRSRAA